jgi:hypothetical protein
MDAIMQFDRKIDIQDPAITKALELAIALSTHCKEHDLPKTLVLDGVAIDAETVIKVAIAKDRSILLNGGEQ